LQPECDFSIIKAFSGAATPPADEAVGLWNTQMNFNNYIWSLYRNSEEGRAAASKDIVTSRLALSSNCMGRYLGTAFYFANVAIKVAIERSSPEFVSHSGSIISCISFKSTQRNGWA